MNREADFDEYVYSTRRRKRRLFLIILTSLSSVGWSVIVFIYRTPLSKWFNISPIAVTMVCTFVFLIAIAFWVSIMFPSSRDSIFLDSDSHHNINDLFNRHLAKNIVD